MPSKLFRRVSGPPLELKSPWQTRVPSACAVHGIAWPLTVWPLSTLEIAADAEPGLSPAPTIVTAHASHHLLMLAPRYSKPRSSGRSQPMSRRRLNTRSKASPSP